MFRITDIRAIFFFVKDSEHKLIDTCARSANRLSFSRSKNKKKGDEDEENLSRSWKNFKEAHQVICRSEVARELNRNTERMFPEAEESSLVEIRSKWMAKEDLNPDVYARVIWIIPPSSPFRQTFCTQNGTISGVQNWHSPLAVVSPLPAISVQSHQIFPQTFLFESIINFCENLSLKKKKRVSNHSKTVYPIARRR
jgi:hypothetical protein